jgi:hypothetical protein
MKPPQSYTVLSHREEFSIPESLYKFIHLIRLLFILCLLNLFSVLGIAGIVIRKIKAYLHPQ